jgi:hypothetical protein
MADDPIKAVIDALNAFQPGRDDIDNVPRLYDIFGDFGSLPHRERAMPAMFFLLERFPDAEFGSPGPLVHELEAIPGYLPLLRDSVRRQPTYRTVWMINRVLNTNLPSDQSGRDEEIASAAKWHRWLMTDPEKQKKFLALDPETMKEFAAYGMYAPDPRRG